MRGVFVAVMLLLMLGAVFADTYVGATLVGVQDNPYDLQDVVGAANIAQQDTVYDGEQQASSDIVGAQDTVYDNEQVASTAVVFDQNATIPIIEANATYDSDNNITTVTVNVLSDPVPTYYVFVYDIYGNLLKSYSTGSPSSSTAINGEYDEVVVIVITNSIGMAGSFAAPVSLPETILGTNIIPVYVASGGKYNVKVYGGYALTPIEVQNGKPFYVVAAKNVVRVVVTTT